MKLDEILESKSYPLFDEIEDYVASKYYIYDSETGRIQIEDSVGSGKTRAKFTIRAYRNQLSVEPDDFVDDAKVQAHAEDIEEDIRQHFGLRETVINDIEVLWEGEIDGDDYQFIIHEGRAQYVQNKRA